MSAVTHTPLMFEQKMLATYQPGGWHAYRRILLGAYLMRLFGLVILTFFAWIVLLQFRDQDFSSAILFVDVVALLSATLAFFYGEYIYTHGGLSSRPLKVVSDGIAIPPLYFNTLKRDKGFIRREEINYLVVRRAKVFHVSMSDSVGYEWRDAPVEFVVHLKKGRRRRSGYRPPETIKEAVDIMQNNWGIKVTQEGQGNGIFRKIVNREVVETVEL